MIDWVVYFKCSLLWCGDFIVIVNFMVKFLLEGWESIEGGDDLGIEVSYDDGDVEE